MYRHGRPAPPPHVAPPLRVHLFERSSALTNVVALAAVALPAAFVLPAALLPYALALAALAALAAAGERTLASVSSAGVELVRYRAWIIPGERQRFLLDVEVDDYQSLEADEPEGICLNPSRGVWRGERESECLGDGLTPPRRERLRRELAAAIATFRALSPPTPRELRCFPLAPQKDALDLARAERNDQGRVVRLPCRAPLRLPGATLPAGSWLDFDVASYVDPSRPDRLVGAELASPCPIWTVEAPAGARLRLDPQDGRVTRLEGPLGAHVRVGVHAVDGRHPLHFDARGELIGYVLAAPLDVGALTLPAGSALRQSPRLGGLPALLRCELGGPLALPELTLEAGDVILFHENGDPAEIAPARDLCLAGRTFARGAGPLLLRPDGRVDLTRAPKPAPSAA